MIYDENDDSVNVPDQRFRAARKWWARNERTVKLLTIMSAVMLFWYWVWTLLVSGFR
jgi:hypothetical protein